MALDFDLLEAQGAERQTAFDTMKSRKLVYDPQILDAFAQLRGVEEQTEVIEELGPDTLAMSTGVGGFHLFREAARDDFVIGIALGDVARGYRWRDASRVSAVNDLVGDVPVVVAANAFSRNVAVFGRIVGDRRLTFRAEGDELVDEETGSRWNTSTGVAVSGPLRSSVLKNIPWSPAFDWAWMNHHPQSTFYRAG